MDTTTNILLVIACITVLLLLLAIFTSKKYNIRRTIIINAPQPLVFDYIKYLKNQDNFNKWVMVEPDMQREFRGTDGTVGFVYGWSGKKAGEGEQEIKAIKEDNTIETEIRFVRPFPATAYADMAAEALPDGTTKVTWSNASTMKYPMNIMLPMIVKMLAKDMDTSLGNLKIILEKQAS